MTREEAIEILEQYSLYSPTSQIKEALNMAIEALSADTVEVVRCKDCKHAYKRKPINKTAVLCEMFVAGMKDNDFCSYGERSEE